LNLLGEEHKKGKKERRRKNEGKNPVKNRGVRNHKDPRIPNRRQGWGRGTGKGRGGGRPVGEKRGKDIERKKTR